MSEPHKQEATAVQLNLQASQYPDDDVRQLQVDDL